jgi:hypothetical protein
VASQLYVRNQLADPNSIDRYSLAMRQRSLCLVNASQYLGPPSFPLNPQVERLARSDTPGRDSMTDNVLRLGSQRYIRAITPSQWRGLAILSASPIGKPQHAGGQ